MDFKEFQRISLIFNGFQRFPACSLRRRPGHEDKAPKARRTTTAISKAQKQGLSGHPGGRRPTATTGLSKRPASRACKQHPQARRKKRKKKGKKERREERKGGKKRRKKKEEKKGGKKRGHPCARAPAVWPVGSVGSIRERSPRRKGRSKPSQT